MTVKALEEDGNYCGKAGNDMRGWGGEWGVY